MCEGSRVVGFAAVKGTVLCGRHSDQGDCPYTRGKGTDPLFLCWSLEPLRPYLQWHMLLARSGTYISKRQGVSSCIC